MKLASEKESLRERVLAAGRALPAAAWRDGSLRVQERVLGLPAFQRARVVALYASLPSEPDTALLFERARADGKRLLFPGYALGAPELREVRDLSELAPGPRGIRHPPRGPAAAPGEADLFVVPGVAFDRQGHRLGRGQGFYDRLLAGRAPSSTSVGLCFDHSLLERIEPEPHDVPVDYVAAPSGLFERPGSQR
ncbi:MAG: 5-formyltetrahydrofolate cyclo-ligase [Myxococcales bacterium]